MYINDVNKYDFLELAKRKFVEPNKIVYNIPTNFVEDSGIRTVEFTISEKELRDFVILLLSDENLQEMLKEDLIEAQRNPDKQMRDPRIAALDPQLPESLFVVERKMKSFFPNASDEMASAFIIPLYEIIRKQGGWQI